MVAAGVNFGLDLAEEIAELKRERNAVILAHNYQVPELQDIADYVGDSLGLSYQAAQTDADVILFCGVHFMAETAKILNPTKTVLLPDLDAGCSLSESCPPEKLQAFLDKHADKNYYVIAYINCSAGVKALSDVICTSSNAEKIVRSFPEGTPIVFAPDRHLGAWVEKKTGRELVKWPGFCIVHEQFTERQLQKLKVRHPEAKLIAHPECEASVLAISDFVGSTKGLLDYVTKSPAKSFIVATEVGILHLMSKARPDAELIPAPPSSGCNCSICPYMRLNSLEKLFLCMRDRSPEITLPEELRLRALKPVQRMLELSA